MTTYVFKPSMKTQKRLLKKAVKLHRNSQSALAEAIGCSQTMVWKLLHGRSAVSISMARAIHIATEGQCPEYELRPDFFEQPAVA